jgi:hypothetical protein
MPLFSNVDERRLPTLLQCNDVFDVRGIIPDLPVTNHSKITLETRQWLQIQQVCYYILATTVRVCVTFVFGSVAFWQHYNR